MLVLTAAGKQQLDRNYFIRKGGGKAVELEGAVSSAGAGKGVQSGQFSGNIQAFWTGGILRSKFSHC